MLKCLLSKKRHQPIVLLNINIKDCFTRNRADHGYGHLGLMSCNIPNTLRRSRVTLSRFVVVMLLSTFVFWFHT